MNLLEQLLSIKHKRDRPEVLKIMNARESHLIEGDIQFVSDIYEDDLLREYQINNLDEDMLSGAIRLVYNMMNGSSYVKISWSKLKQYQKN